MGTRYHNVSIFHRSAHAFAILNKYPYNNGHLLVIPRRHTADFTSLNAEELGDLHALLQTSVRLVREALPYMRAAGWGRICCITSYTVKQPAPVLALSNTARTGLWAWIKTAAQDLAAESSGITLNMICPGPHATDRMKELGGAGVMGDPADFGSVVAFVCSAHAGFINGSAVVVDGGSTLAL